MSFSDLLKSFETDVRDVLLPQDAPSDTREADALAKVAQGVAVSVDPELAPMYDRIGVLGDYIEQALHELGTIVGTMKATVAARAQQVPPPETPAPVASEPSSTPTDSAASSTEPSTEETSSETGASMADTIPPTSSDPQTADTTASPTPPTDQPITGMFTTTPSPTSE
ncbi:MAG: hypothetical protein WBS24_03420 [Terriglobales bacterium]